VKVAIVGGTGDFGRGVAKRLSASGDDVVIGSRDAERAEAAGRELGVDGGANQEVVRGADVVVLAVAAGAAVQTAKSLARAIGSTPLLSVASELRFGKGTVRPGSEGASVAEQIAQVVPGPVAAGLHSLAASTLGGSRAPDEDAFVCGDDEDAKALSLQLASRVVAGRALDAGPLANARALEGLTAVIVSLNRRYKGHAGIRVTGLS
jgi:NADPH-dependent F420 reductase